MDYRSLGASGLNVPVIGLGTANFRGGSSPGQGLGDKAASRLVDIAIERGAAFFDTGDIYGLAEEVLGKAVARCRSRVLIGTKAGLRVGEGANDTPVLALIVGFTQTPFACGPCTIVPSPDVMLAGGGPVSVAVPFDANLIGVELYTQWLQWRQAGCAVLPDFGFSNTLKFTVAE